MQHPIISPQNPYVGPLRVFPGTLVKIAGRPRPNATRLAINFQTGPSLNPRDDLALHLSPCFTPPRIIRNSLQNGAWGLEESWSNGSIMSPHVPFEFIILVEPEQFKIALNGAHYCEFKHRIPYHQVSHLSIDGDVDIDRIEVSSSQGPQVTPTYDSASAPPSFPHGAPGMPMPPMYPNLGPNPAPPTHYPAMPSVPTASGPAPMPASYASGFPQPAPYPQPGPYPQPNPSQGPYPPQTGGPMPTGAYYSGGYPPPAAGPAQPQPSSSSIFGSLPFGKNKALGTVAGLAAGAAVLSMASHPIKTVKKIMKPHKAFKHKGWGKSSSSSSSSSSNSSRGSFSSNSS